MEKKIHKVGFPTINVCENYFEVKAIDNKQFRRFDFSEIARIEYYKGGGNWSIWPLIQLILNKFEPHKLKIVKINGGDWIYDTPPKFDKDFDNFTKELNDLCTLLK